MRPSHLITFTFAILAPTALAQGPVERVSVASGGTQSFGLVDGPWTSGDGRYVAFASDATDLVPNDTNNVSDVFVRDRMSGTTERVSVSALGVLGDLPSSHASISEDGRFVAFTSFATNLDPGDLNQTCDVFVRDRQLGTTRLVSRNPFAQAGAGSSFSPSISGDGNWVVFFSDANDLDLADTSPYRDAFLLERSTGLIQIASLTTTGGPGDFHTGSSYAIPGGTGISRDGRYAVFTSFASLDPIDQNGEQDIYVRDRVAGTTRLVSLDSTGQISLYEAFQPAISGDGRFVVFYSSNPHFVPNDTNGLDVFVREILTGATERVSVDSFGAQVTYVGPIQPQLVGYPSISYDGRFVAFETAMQKLVPGDTGTRPDVFVHDRTTHVTQLVSRGLAGGAGNFGSVRAAISSDGAFVAFQSDANDLVAGDTNAKPDVFIGVVPESPTAYCFGDGSGTACPCGNSGAQLSGCANSVDPRGARLVGTGRASVGDDTLTLLVNGLPASTMIAYFQGTVQVLGGSGAVFGDGLRCAGGATLRLGSRTGAAGLSSFGHTIAGDPPISVAGQVPPNGGLRYYQAYYRNAAGFCTSSTFNLTNGLSLTWSP
jgi:Tol biopolymer transport system component